METIKLTAMHRCDACSAAAKAVAIKGDAILLFCGHHSKKNGSALVASGFMLLGSEEE